MNTKAADDELFVCLACGKTSNYKYGFHETDIAIKSPGWDESCTLNCELFKKKDLIIINERVVEIKK